MIGEHPRMKREKDTIYAMVRIFCSAHHSSQCRLCMECTEFLEYARMRLDACPFQEKKTTCAKCKIHCYNPAMREKARKIMRYSGPRMLWQHPLLALNHAIDAFRGVDQAKTG